jgi:outer membrane receptor protein involved in Fe transport
MLNKKIKSALFLATYSCVSMAADVNENTPDKKPQAADPNAAIQLDEIEVKAKRRRIITPLPGLPIDKETATTNIQSATGKEITESKALNLTDYLNSNMQSVSVNDYAGNPFQQDLNFRGFSASPQIGTPQGISVYLDGVRVNEPFGEVVNWDLIPMNAIASLDIIPGSNPLFGLNTIGGALAIKTRDGFSDHFLRAQQLMGDWGRKQTQFSNGIHGERFALFTAYNHFYEDGWRVNSPSNLRQLFNKVSLRLDSGEINLSSLNVDTSLLGNGMLPKEMADVDREGVFTSPDQAKNQLDHYNLSGTWYATDKLSLSGLIYKRALKQNAVSADIYQGYFPMIVAKDGETTDNNGDGIDDLFGRLNGILNQSTLDSKADGFNLQLTYEGDKHQFAVGATVDATKIAFQQSQSLGELDASHAFHFVSDPFLQDPDNLFYVQTSSPGVIRNQLKGTSNTKSLFFTDTWSPIDSLHITFGTRWNWTNVKNTLRSDRGADMYQFQGDVLTNPAKQICRKSSSDFTSRYICSEGDYDYRSFNPSLGIAWEVEEDLTAYGNVSRGSRVPSVIELGCAKEEQENLNNSTNFQFGCSIPTALTADPYLKQVRSLGYETGMRGTLEGFDWNIGLFQTNLTDDILFVPLGRKNRGVFDNFGKTRREGVEMGLKGNWGKSTISLNYTWMRATFESPAQLINDANSTNTAVTTNQAYVNVRPGDQIPGMPNHILQANWNYKFTPSFDMTLNMVAHSFSYVRGNENNEHEARAATFINDNKDIYDFTGGGKIAGYAIFNLRANYKFSEAFSMFLKVDNLLDKLYSTAGNLGRNPFTPQGAFQVAPVVDANGNPQRVDKDWVNSTFISPGAPRAAWVGLSFDWDWDKVKKSKASKELE